MTSVLETPLPRNPYAVGAWDRNGGTVNYADAPSQPANPTLSRLRQQHKTWAPGEHEHIASHIDQISRLSGMPRGTDAHNEATSYFRSLQGNQAVGPHHLEAIAAHVGAPFQRGGRRSDMLRSLASHVRNRMDEAYRQGDETWQHEHDYGQGQNLWRHTPTQESHITYGHTRPVGGQGWMNVGAMGEGMAPRWIHAQTGESRLQHGDPSLPPPPETQEPEEVSMDQLFSGTDDAYLDALRSVRSIHQRTGNQEGIERINRLLEMEQSRATPQASQQPTVMSMLGGGQIPSAAPIAELADDQTDDTPVGQLANDGSPTQQQQRRVSQAYVNGDTDDPNDEGHANTAPHPFTEAVNREIDRLMQGNEVSARNANRMRRIVDSMQAEGRTPGEILATLNARGHTPGNVYHRLRASTEQMTPEQVQRFRQEQELRRQEREQRDSAARQARVNQDLAAHWPDAKEDDFHGLLGKRRQGDNVHVTVHRGGGVGLDLIRKDGTTFNASVEKSQNGNVMTVGGYFEGDKSTRGHNFGRDDIHSLYESAKKLGVERIYTHGGRGGSMIGYREWPKMGFDANLSQSTIRRLPESLKSAKTIQDLYSSQEGRDWWKENGSGMDMTLQLKGDSPGTKKFLRMATKRGEK